MHSCIEYLSDTIAIIRTGEFCQKWGDPYDYAVVVVLKPIKNVAEVKALVADGNFKLRHSRSIIKLIHGLGYTVLWERLK